MCAKVVVIVSFKVALSQRKTLGSFMLFSIIVEAILKGNRETLKFGAFS